MRPGSLRLTKKCRVAAADLTISEGGVAVKYNVYLRDGIALEFGSTDPNRVELAAWLLKLAGIGAEVKKVGDGDGWRIEAATDMLAAGHEKFREALSWIVETARGNGWVDEKKAELWLEMLGKGRVLMEGWPRHLMRLAKGALAVRFASPNPDSIRQVVQRLKEIGLEEGRHFTVKMPEEGHDGYVYIRREGLAHAAWLSAHGSGRQRDLAADFVEYILRRAEEADREVYEKAREIVEEGEARSSLKLEGFEKEVEVEGKKHVVKVIDGGAEFDVGRGGRKLLRIRITAEADGVRREYVITYGRYDRNAAKGFAVARAEADAERHSALVEALTGRRPRVYRMKDGRIKIECYEGHLEGFMRYAELADAIARWLEETDR